VYSSCMHIDTNIPPPGDAPPRQKYPFPDMLVGDSFLFTEDAPIQNLRTAAYMYGRRHPGVKFTVRKHGDGWRVWRVA
jgi:hypothetical protein